MKSKAEQRHELLVDVLAFAQTHHIEILPPQRKKVKSVCKAKGKQFFKAKPPVNRPSMNFDLMPNH